ncbi:type II secretion system secretin GspD [Pseudoroseicyclus tamaricis]|uniref:Type II secretion system secretin GspD n=1 Tax=Pseudoroseicyclus tamaricis TaxID=2705421 RepID=A0A6B2K2B3_9RHOB|nr:type II secretion system secretin GspD [Pseudoroseicyclus tamaricis]NDV00576.1 type II secretion system secretin GspD [Pseudoroseicyclus tamaricis]
MSLINASIPAAAEAVLGGILHRSYFVADDVDGRVTIQTTGPIPKTALFDLFDAALRANGLRIEDQGGLFAIVEGSRGPVGLLPANGIGYDEYAVPIVIAPLRFVSANEMAGLMAPLAEGGLSITPDQNRNLLLLSGSATILSAAVEALNIFDVDVMQGRSVALFRLEAADPDDIVEELRAIFESQEGGSLDGVIEFVPNERLNSVLVLTARSEYLDRARRWIRDLDRSAGQSQAYTRIYTLNNRRAEEVAPILDQLLSESPAVTSLDGADEGAGAGAITGTHVAADPERNALIVRGLRREHDEVGRVLADLDQRAPQVALEATIVEVTLNDQLQLGVRWFFENSNLRVGFTDAANGSFGQNYPGFSSAFSVGDAGFVLNTLSGVTDVSVIASPTLVVLDNKEAVLQIGDQVPVATQTSNSTTSDDAPVITSVSYRDTGIILSVRPQIGATGRLTLDISQEVSSVIANSTSGINSPTIRQRQIETTVAVQDGSTLVLGGLIQEGSEQRDAAVPGLGEIPVLGAAFRSRDSRRNRTELLLLIHPRVMHDELDAFEYTSEMRNRIGDADADLIQGLGPPRHSLEDMLR